MIVGFLVLTPIAYVLINTDSPSVEHLPNVTIIKTKENFTLDNISIEVTKAEAWCEFKVFDPGDDFKLYKPERYLFSPTLSGDTCQCPYDMYTHSEWEYRMFGSLYQPQMSYNVSTGYIPLDQCIATNCYTSGLVPIGKTYFLHPKSPVIKRMITEIDVNGKKITLTDGILEETSDNITVGFDGEIRCSETDFVVYENEVKHTDPYIALWAEQYMIKNYFRYRIENRDNVIEDMNSLLEDKVEDCVYSNMGVRCKAEIVGDYTVMVGVD